MERVCAKCHQSKPIEEFLQTSSPFHPGGYTIYCTNCLEEMVPPDDLRAVDKLMAWLDWPFLVPQWTKCYRNAKSQALHLYKQLMKDRPQYQTLDWKETNDKWKEAMELGVMDEKIPDINQAWLREMRLKWPADVERTVEDYRYLENFYNDLISTQNITSATQRDDAKRLCEVGLLATKKIRQGLPAKDEMAIYHNIMKAEGFEAKNAKNVGDFDTFSEFAVWLEKRGWKPDWHVEPQDSVDFTMKQIQTFLVRLVKNEGNLPDQVASREKQLELANRLEEDNDGSAATDSTIDEQAILDSIQYEDDEELDNDIGVDDDCLN